MSRKPPVLDQLNIVVRDMAAAVGFYRALGVEVPDAAPEWRAWDAHHRTAQVGGDMDLDLDSAVFAAQWNRGFSGSGGVVIGFRVGSREEVDEVYGRLLEAGGTERQPPYDAFWGARYAIVADPSGNAVGIMSPVDPERRTRPDLPG